MDAFSDISLKNYNSFGCEGRAERIFHAATEEEAASLICMKEPLLVLGSGTNILFLNGFRGKIIRPEMKGIDFADMDEDNVHVSAGAGVIWDDLVKACVERGLSGLENLSLIPGTVGATPVQNIGAYGVEVSESIVSVRALNLGDGSVRTFSGNECGFGYRESIFKNEEKGKWLITKVTYCLTKEFQPNLEYGSLKQEIAGCAEINPAVIREAVIRIRRSKLPDPSVTGNAGSFFRNPEVKVSLAGRLKEEYPDLPVYPGKNGNVKLAAGWLIEKCGWKGRRIGDAGVHEKQALVLVNFGAATGMDIYKLSEMIRESVLEKFGVSLEREVEVIRAT